MGKRITVTCGQCNARSPTTNVYYPEDVMAEAVEKMQDRIIENGPIPGCCGNEPGNPATSFDRVSHVTQNIWIDEETKAVKAEIQILETDMGKALLGLLQAGMKTSFGIRGQTLKESKEAEFLEIIAIDAQAIPSHPIPPLPSGQSGQTITSMDDDAKADAEFNEMKARGEAILGKEFMGSMDSDLLRWAWDDLKKEGKI